MTDIEIPRRSIQIREESIVVEKYPVKLADVTVYLRRVTEDVTCTIPIAREEYVIDVHRADGETETVRIPFWEEQMEWKKHPVILEEVEILKRLYHEETKINVPILREIVRITASGRAAVKEE